MTDQQNKLNKIVEQFSRQWTEDNKRSISQSNGQSNQKVYIFDCPFSELHPVIKQCYEYYFDSYFKNKISFENTFFIYAEYLDECHGGKQLKFSDIDESANSQAFLGCTFEKMREVYHNVVYKTKQDLYYDVTFPRFVEYTITVDDQRYCLAELDYLSTL